MARNRVSDYTASTTKAAPVNSAKAAPPPAPTPDDPHDVAKPVNGEYADATAFNAEWQYDQHDTVNGLPFQVFDHIGETLRGKLVLGYFGDWDTSRPGINNVRTQIDIGQEVTGYQDGTITWGFFDFRNKLGPNSSHEGKGYFPFTDAQKIVARQSIASWDDLVSTTFVEKDYDEHSAKMWAHNDIDILLANTTTGPAQAWAYYPNQGNAYKRASSDVWIGAAADNRTNLWDGGYGQTTQVHELGHTLGLSHPGNYNFGSGGPITYVDSAFYFQDNRQYTTMSYFDSYEVGSNYIDWNLMRFMYAATPMVDDIWILQQKYGAETTTRTGDSTYGFNSTADVTNTAMKFVAGEQMTIFTIWDANGNDTLDLSGYHTPSVIDLREGAYSSAGGWNAYGNAPADSPLEMSDADYLAYVNANNAAVGMPARSAALVNRYLHGDALIENVSFLDVVGGDLLMENNIGIAYGAVIENAKGGYGDDRINGNWATNYLTGNGGADTFVIFDNTGTNAVGVARVDTRHDYITDFATGVDKIDLTEFAGVDSGDVQFVGGDLLIDTDGNGSADFTVTLLGGATINTTSDIVYHS